MDPKYNALNVSDLDVDDVIPVDRRPIVKYCKIDCLGNNATFLAVQTDLEFGKFGRPLYSTITYDFFKKTIECENVYEFFLDYIRDNYKVVVEFKRE